MQTVNSLTRDGGDNAADSATACSTMLDNRLSH